MHSVIEPEQRFSHLTVLRQVAPGDDRRRRYLCRCDCGRLKVVRGDSLLRGLSNSCGCFKIERLRDLHTVHGRFGTPEYGVWAAMLRRVRNPQDSHYHRYGGRGIRVVPRWERFEHFFSDMGLRPSSAHSIDRIDNNGHYEPSNCRWATAKEQANNRGQANKALRDADPYALPDDTGRAVRDFDPNQM